MLPNASMLATDEAGPVIQDDRPEHREVVRAFLLDADLPLEPYEGSAAPW